MGRKRTFVAGIVAVLVVAGLAAVGPAEAQAPTGTVIIQVGEPSGSYATGFCLQPGSLVFGSFTCSDGTPQYVDFVGAGGTTTRSLAPGSYTAALGSLSPGAIGATGTVTVTAGETITCTFTMAAAPSCADSPSPGAATVIISVDAPAGSYATGFCPVPGTPVLGSTVCSNGSSANVDFLSSGATVVRSLPAGSYNAGVAQVSPLTAGAFGPVTLAADAVLSCVFSMTVAPSCTPFDGNGDGTPDGEQPNVGSVVAADGASVITVAGEDADFPISDLVTLGVPASPPPPGPMPLGLVGFSVTLPVGVTTADVSIHFPSGTGPTGYVKLQGGAWVDVSSQATIDGDVVTLHLVDNDALDTDPTVGVIGDPGGPVVAPVPSTAADCRQDGWRTRTDGSGRPFRNQGDCVSFVATGGRNPAAG